MMIKRFKSFPLPKSLSARILLTFLVVSLLPLALFGTFSMQFVKSAIFHSAERAGNSISTSIVGLYQSHLQSQADIINTELINIEQHVLLVQKFAEQVYNEPHLYPVLTPIVFNKDVGGYYWESERSPDQSNTGATGHFPITSNLVERLERSKYIESMFQQSLKNNPSIVAMYLTFPESAWRIYPSIDLKKEIEQRFFDPSIPVTSYPFYTQALPSSNPHSEVVWTDRYLDITHRSWMLTSSAPVLTNSSSLVGVVSADIAIDKIVENILNTKFNHKDSYAFLLNQSGNVIAVQEGGKDKVYSLPLSRITEEGETTASTITYLSDQQILLTANIPSSHWYLGYVIPKEEMVSPIFDEANQQMLQSGKQITSQLSIASVVITLLCIGMTFVMWSKIIDPIRKLLTGIQNVGAGNFNVQIPRSGISEFDQLSSSFNLMSREVDSLVHALDQRIAEKEILQNQLLILNESLEKTVTKRTDQLRKTNQTLTHRNEQLKRMEESRSALFANISHDLKTPLTIVSGYIEAIRDGLIPEEENELYLERIQQRIASITRLVHDLNELSLLETRSKKLSRRNLDLTEFIEKLKQRYSSLEIVGSSPVHVNFFDNGQTAQPLSRFQLNVDEDHLYRAIDNLIDNSQKYGSKDQPVSVYLAIVQNQFIIAIQDQGIGIAEEHLPFLFQRTYRADKARNTSIPGNGLGLAIVKEIIEAHDGEVSVQSELNKGTTFTVKLPLISEI